MTENSYTRVRLSHILGYAGVGSVVRSTNELLVVVADTRYWSNMNNELLHVKRISKLIADNKKLIKPPIAKQLSEKNTYDNNNTILSTVFPKWGICKKCGLLHYLPNFLSYKCENCGFSLEQITWVIISNKGWLDDVQWHEFVHDKKSSCTCIQTKNIAYLELKNEQSGKLKITCKKCNATKISRFTVDEGFFVNNEQPWIDKKPEIDKSDKPEYLIVEINDPRIYNPTLQKAIVIPPESRRKAKKDPIDLLKSSPKILEEILSIKQPLKRDRKIQSICEEFEFNIVDFKNALNNSLKSNDVDDNEIMTSGDLLLDEYNALISEVLDYDERWDDFITVNRSQEFHCFINNNNSELIKLFGAVVSQVVSVTRLREIQLTKGFKRQVSENDEKNILIPPDLDGSTDFYPAIELWGEGIFIAFNIDNIEIWEKNKKIIDRAKKLSDRYEKSSIMLDKNLTITPRFLLLHTLSHLIMRALEVYAGYPASSMSERIYSSKSSKMAGILIYTSVSDSAGSLGGLIAQSSPENIIRILINSFESAQWCSLDPVCGSHDGQGPDSLNRAACHACCIVPETSCNYRNMLLDRVFIKGCSEDNITSFLDVIKGVNNA